VDNTRAKQAEDDTFFSFTGDDYNCSHDHHEKAVTREPPRRASNGVAKEETYIDYSFHVLMERFHDYGIVNGNNIVFWCLRLFQSRCLFPR
jgi:hypothetical protein